MRVLMELRGRKGDMEQEMVVACSSVCLFVFRSKPCTCSYLFVYSFACMHACMRELIRVYPITPVGLLIHIRARGSSIPCFTLSIRVLLVAFPAGRRKSFSSSPRRVWIISLGTIHHQFEQNFCFENPPKDSH